MEAVDPITGASPLSANGKSHYFLLGYRVGGILLLMPCSPELQCSSLSSHSQRKQAGVSACHPTSASL
jgi:hypothetical protein